MSAPRTYREALIAEMLGDIYKIYIRLEAINLKIESTNQSLDLATKRFLDASQAYEANARKALQTLTTFSANQVFNESLLPKLKDELKTIIDDELHEFDFINQHRIEPRIRSLVLAMNRTGHFKTLASCEGHIVFFPWPCMSINHPFIYFKSKPEIYRALFARLEYFGARTRLKRGYAALGLRMHPQEGVCMYIDLEYGKRWVTRKQVDEDIACLSEILRRDIFEGLTDNSGQGVAEKNHGANEND